MPSAKSFFNEQEQKLLIKAIEQAELETSGEIRVHVENFCFGNELKTASRIFTRLGMRKTKERNGIIIYIATMSRKIAVYDHKAEGLANCIVDCGAQLGKYFPRTSDDKNELSNKISF
jgi:arginine repressor